MNTCGFLIDGDPEPDGNKIHIMFLIHIKWTDLDTGRTCHFRLIEKVSNLWRDMGGYIGISSNTLNGYEFQYRGDVKLCWQAVMRTWLRGKDIDKKDYIPASWEKLYVLLSEDMEIPKVAEELKEAVSHL